jgi:hypothetical protein
MLSGIGDRDQLPEPGFDVVARAPTSAATCSTIWLSAGVDVPDDTLFAGEAFSW